MRSVKFSEFMELLEGGEDIVKGYTFSRNQLQAELRPKLQELVKDNKVLENEFKDYVSMVELEATIAGLYCGMKIVNSLNNLP